MNGTVKIDKPFFHFYYHYYRPIQLPNGSAFHFTPHWRLRLWWDGVGVHWGLHTWMLGWYYK